MKQLNRCGRFLRAVRMHINILVAASALTLSGLPWATTARVGAIGLPPGTIVSAAQMTLHPTLSQVATGLRVRYVSRNSQNQPIIVSGAILTPRLQYRLAHPQNANKTVAWAHGTSGMGDSCAPSVHPNLYPDPEYQVYADNVAPYLAQGWTVAATDYPGMGTSGTHPYLIGDSEARAVIDSVRAARFMKPFLSNQWVVVGHSQGGQAALFTNEIASAYGAELSLKGSIAIAPASSIEILAMYMPGTPANGYAVMGTYGLAAVDPTVNPADVLTPEAVSLAGVLETGCYNEVMATYEPFTAEELVIGGQFSPEILAKLAMQNPGQAPNTVPTLLVQGDADVTIPVEITQMLQAQQCSLSTQPVQLNIYPGMAHDPVVYASSNDVIDYITARFANQPAPSNCP